MSLETWKAEYWLVDGREPDFEAMSDIEATAHSLRKWTGALPLALRTHNVVYENLVVFDEGQEYPDIHNQSRLGFHSETCALCAKHYDDIYCLTCPLAHHLGMRCDAPEGGPWQESGSDPMPMIRALSGTLIQLKVGASPQTSDPKASHD